MLPGDGGTGADAGQAVLVRSAGDIHAVGAAEHGPRQRVTADPGLVSFAGVIVPGGRAQRSLICEEDASTR
jgi:hypothetical protein